MKKLGFVLTFGLMAGMAICGKGITASAAEHYEPMVHNVQPRENSYRISINEDIPYSTLVELNPQIDDFSKIKPTDSLIVGYRRIWVIENANEGLYQISRLTGVPFSTIKELNPMENYNLLQRGQCIFLGKVYELPADVSVENLSTDSVSESATTNTTLDSTITVTTTTTASTETTSKATTNASKITSTSKASTTTSKTSSTTSKASTTTSKANATTSKANTANAKPNVASEKNALLASTSLSRPGVSSGSWTNIKLSCSQINGMIIQPGATFDWWRDVGRCSKANGYVLAGAYSGGKLIEAYGGGICFTSTALMQGARAAGLQIIKKYDHSLPVTYAKRGDEAAISWGTKNMVFYNNTLNPIQISMTYNTNSPTVYVKILSMQ